MDTFDKETLSRLIQTVIILAVAFGLFFGLRGRIATFATWARLPRLAFTPVRLTLRYGILALALVLVLGRWGFQVDALIAVAGTILGLVAIGFVAMWSVLSNLLCAFVLVMFKPFSVGDELEISGDGGARGKVADLSLIFTVLHTQDGEQVIVPNNIFFQRIFRRREGRVTTSLEHQLDKGAAAPPVGASAQPQA